MPGRGLSEFTGANLDTDLETESSRGCAAVHHPSLQRRSLAFRVATLIVGRAYLPMVQGNETPKDCGD